MSGNVFQFDVDTTPMGNSLLSISGDVQSATGAVARSTDLLVTAEEEGSRQVSRNITAGFLALIRSQLEQKKAAAKSGIDAKNAQLIGEKRAGDSMEMQFIGDFNRIKGRYTRLFASLDKALKNRVAELDKPVFQLIEKEYRFAIRKRLYSIGSSMVSGAEGGRVNSLLRMGQAKGQVLKLLDSTKNYLVKTQRLNLQIASILGKTRAEKATEISLPFIVAEADGAFHGQRTWAFRMPSGTEGFDFHRDFDSGLAAIDPGKGSWETPSPEQKDRIAQGFFALLEGAGLEQRVRDQVKRLYEASDWTTMKDVAG